MAPSERQEVDDSETTQREAERQREDRDYTRVVVKRSDQALRHPDDTLQHAIKEGQEQSERRWLSLLLSSVSAGAILSFSAMAVGAIAPLADAQDHEITGRLMTAALYPLGFVLCLMSGTQLFTEHTALAVYPVLDGRTRAWRMLRVWGLVLLGNVMGCALGAGLLAAADGVIQSSEGYDLVAHHLAAFGSTDIFFSALLAGWLMALGGWLVLSTPPDVSQILVIFLATFLISVGGLHHSIAGAAEAIVAKLTGSAVPTTELLRSWSVMVLGNLAGGSLFVALLNYGHIRKTQTGEDGS